jgi:pseudouridine-5'-phosphate glycosidase
LFDFWFRENNVIGNEATPFLLARVNELTGGASLAASILYRTYYYEKISIVLLE